jgi:hypothetical protein
VLNEVPSLRVGHSVTVLVRRLPLRVFQPWEPAMVPFTQAMEIRRRLSNIISASNQITHLQTADAKHHTICIF